MQAAEQNQKYRELLEELITQSHGSYDKAVMALSGGALGISFSFVDRFVDTKDEGVHLTLLYVAWACWALSLCACLYSFLSSAFALDKELKEFDAGKERAPRKAFVMDFITRILNISSGLLFLAGGVFLVVFIATAR